MEEGEEEEEVEQNEEVGTGSTYTARMSWDTLNVPQPTGQCGDLEADWTMRCLLLCFALRVWSLPQCKIKESKVVLGMTLLWRNDRQQMNAAGQEG